MSLSFLFQCVILLMFLLVCSSGVQAIPKRFHVMKYGAVYGGKVDNNKAFLETWKHACEYTGGSIYIIPRGTFLLSPVKFLGPCKGPIQVLIRGDLIAPKYNSSTITDYWILFSEIDGLTIDGSAGSLDGQGPSAWPYKGCKTKACKTLAMSLRLDFVNNSRIEHITSINSQDKHMKLFASNNIKLSNIKIVAPGESPNTDGIYIATSTYVDISDTNIGTGDDCICFGPGAQNINISNVNCGPGHGISIGSLGGTADEVAVTGFIIKNSTFTGTQNGLRIKTWETPNPGIVSNITFQDIIIKDVTNPIVIDQHYCPDGGCPKGESHVAISDIKFLKVRGSSSSKVALNLRCSKDVPCKNIELVDIDLNYYTGGETSSVCENLEGVISRGLMNPTCKDS